MVDSSLKNRIICARGLGNTHVADANDHLAETLLSNSSVKFPPLYGMTHETRLGRVTISRICK
jgi:hypothetical protein